MCPKKGAAAVLKGRHLIDPMDFTVEELDSIFQLAEQMALDPAKYIHLCDGYLLATLFFEPSTRTRFSFEAAMQRLGGRVIGFAEPGATSTAKGETLADTIRTISCYADIITIRHPREGSALVAAMYATVPVINAGDGSHHHPTQTLTDLLTIKALKGTLSGLTIGCCGDLKNGRTVHSLLRALSRYPGNRFLLVSPRELSIPDYLRSDLEDNNTRFCELTNLEEAIPQLDLLYMTRIQKERFSTREEYERLKDSYVLDAEKMKAAGKDMNILHPLPRVNEIAYELDEDPRACYFRQARYGMFARMALISKLLGV